MCIFIFLFIIKYQFSIKNQIFISFLALINRNYTVVSIVNRNYYGLGFGPECMGIELIKSEIF